MTGFGAESLGDGLRAAVRHLAVRLRAGGEHDPGRGRAQRVEVGLVVGARHDVLEEQRVGPVAVVLGGQPEHRRVGGGLGGELRGHRPLVAHGQDELRHAGAEAAALVGVGDRLGDRQRALAIGQDRGERRLVRDERPDLLRVGRHEGERVHRAAAAREQVDRAAAELVDDPVQVVGVLLGRGLRWPDRP